MEFEQTYNGPADWNFPSPSATPTNGSFGNNVFQTPKTSTFPSHFQDAFTTPQMPTFATPQQIQSSSMTPVQRPQSSSETLRSNFYAKMHAGGSQSMPPPVHHANFHSVASPIQPVGFQISPHPPMDQVSFDPSQMQTPPPTRGTSAKKLQQQPHIAFGTPSMIASRRFVTPEHPANGHGHGHTQASHQTPVQFRQLQCSPEVYQFANIGPASAPVMPQTQIMWEQTGSPNGFSQLDPLDDPFAPNAQQSMLWSSATMPQTSVQAMAFDTPAMSSFPVQAPHPRPASAALMSGNVSHPPMLEIPSASVDPSLVYSSPLRPVLRSNSKPSRSHITSAPGVRRKDNALASHIYSETVSSAVAAIKSSDAGAATGGGLRRSHTTGAVRPKSAHFATTAVETLSRSNSVTQVPRTSSPLKRVGKTALGSISEARLRPRTSVILTVDETGRARTETRRLDKSPTRSIRERYPGLFDSDSSDDDSDVSEQPTNRNPSFTFVRNDERRAKAARLDPPVENLEGLDLPRSSSRASMRGVAPSRAAVAAAAQLRRQNSIRKSTPSRSISKRKSMTRSSSAAIDTCPMDPSVEQSQAVDGAEDSQCSHNVSEALEYPSLGDTFNPNATYGPQHTSAESTLEAHNRRWSMMSVEQQMQQQAHDVLPQHAVQQQTLFRPLPNAHSQAYGLPQASSMRHIRCICGVTHDRGQVMVRCSSCTQWLHAFCVGVDAQMPPITYTCFLCTKPPNQI